MVTVIVAGAPEVSTVTGENEKSTRLGGDVSAWAYA